MSQKAINTKEAATPRFQDLYTVPETRIVLARKNRPEIEVAKSAISYAAAYIIVCGDGTLLMIIFRKASNNHRSLALNGSKKKGVGI